ncbi:class I SAM-dependent methyltransferase [Gordonia sputi]|uniref:class I SAM-dependent methyltransferase n=1 Tax=Gordonia sputi TaxID=36823 RepID=UPI0036981127
MGTGDGRPRWNHNIHYHRLVIEAVCSGAQNALDVGTGNGLLAAELRARVPVVVAIDADAAVLAEAREEIGDVDFVHGDVMTHRFETRFDVVASIATLHHLSDLDAVFARLSDLTEPGGVVVVVGLARATRLSEYAKSLVGVVQHRWLSWRRGYWEHSAPTAWPPPHSYSDVRDSVQRVLPGAEFRQLALFRYAVLWRKPS